MRRLPAFLVALLAATPLAAQDGRKVALLVGVTNYRDTELSSLKYAENDVTALSQLLLASGFRRAVLVTESEAIAKRDAQLVPTADNVRTHLRAVLADRGPNDTVALAFTGHGVEPRGGKGLFFCPQGADLADPKTLVPLTEVFDALKSCRAGVKLMLVDACRNDPLAGKSAVVAGLPSLSRPAVPEPPAGTVALFSCSQGEKSFESDRLRHGVFFYHVLEGLRGRAANPRTGVVDVQRLALYVADRVPETVEDEFGPAVRQRPNAVGDLRGLVPLLRVPAHVVARPRELAALTPPSPRVGPFPRPEDIAPQPIPGTRGVARLVSYGGKWSVERYEGGIVWTRTLLGPPPALAVSPDGSRIFVAARDDLFALDTRNGKAVWQRPTRTALTALQVSDDGRTLTAVGGSGQRTDLDARTGAAR